MLVDIHVAVNNQSTKHSHHKQLYSIRILASIRSSRKISLKMNSLKIKYIANLKYGKIVYCVFVSTIVILFYQTSFIRDTSPKYATDMTEAVQIVNHRQNLKYILLWTHPEDTPFVYFGQGTSVFQNKTCQWPNCYVTGNRNFLQDYTEFDVIAFSSSRLLQMAQELDIPTRRSNHQKYVFASVESAEYYPICTNDWNNFFNWTWTYKLKSDAVWGYMIIKNATGHVVGPKSEMHWIDSIDMDDIDNDLRRKLRSKSKVAAWFASNCETMSRREEVVKDIDRELNRYKLSIHIFGSCGKYYCPKKIFNRCFKMLEKDYFFYFAFENSFSEDYVTEKLMYALQHNTVPVVYGGANYSRYLPKGSYLDAQHMRPANLAQKLVEIVNNPEAYFKFFRWKKYYSYHYRHESSDTDDYCRFCAMLNNENLVKRRTQYPDIKTWWTDKNIICTKN